MRRSVVFFLFSVCLVAANTQAQVSATLEDDFLVKDNADLDARNIFDNLKAVLHKSDKIISRIKCVIEEVKKIRSASMDFINDVEKCKGSLTRDVEDLVNHCKTVVSTFDGILFNYEEILSNAAEFNDKRYELMSNKMLELNHEDKDGLSTCMLGAMKKWGSVIISFPINVERCLANGGSE